MNAVEILLDRYWVNREEDKEMYYEVKRTVNDRDTKRFFQEMLGWKCIHTEHILKLEKIPAHAESFMGIQAFTEIRDYCLLCAVLMFLEDKEENSQFLLSELIRYVETVLAKYIEVDWTSFSQRKSMVRVLKFVEEKGMLKVYEGNSSAYGTEQSSEVLYENTGLSRYFATNFTMNISGFTSWKDFEKKQMEELQEDRGNLRTNRVFRQLVVCPCMYWEDSADPDVFYLRNKKNYIAANIARNMGGTLEISKNTASVVFLDTIPVGEYHPKTGMLSEIVLLACHAFYTMAQDKRRVTMTAEDTLVMSVSRFEDILMTLRNRYGKFWSKEYRELSREKYIAQVKKYMKDWMMMSETDTECTIYPVSALVTGGYSAYMEEKVDE